MRLLMRIMNRIKIIIIIILMAITAISASAAPPWKTLQTEPNKPFPLVFNAVYLNNKWFICGYGEIYVSDDNLKSSTKVQLFPAAAPKAMFSGAMTGMTYGNKNYVAITGNKILVSQDGLNWSERVSYFHTGTNASIAYGNGRYVIVGGDGIKDTVILTATDPMKWDKISFKRFASSQHGKKAYPRLNYVSYVNDKFIATGKNSTGKGALYTSKDGTNWEELNTTTNEAINAITYGNGEYIAIGKNGLIIASKDLSLWEEINSNITDDLYGITYGNGQYVAVGKGGVMTTSPDGKTWNNLKPIGKGDIYSITYASDAFVAAGVNGVIIRK